MKKIIRNFISTKHEYLEKMLLTYDNVNIGDDIYSSYEYNLYSKNNLNLVVCTFPNLSNFVMVFVITDETNNEIFVPCRGMIEVTNHEIFGKINIKELDFSEKLHNSVISSNVIIEGTDFTGKTFTITQLLDDGIVCADRDKRIYSKMLFDVKLEDRIKGYREFLKSSNIKVIVLINNDEQELLRRMRKRESEGDKIDEWDSQAYAFNGLYYQTFQTMLDLNICTDSFVMIDVTGLDEIEQYKKVKQIITMKFL